MKRKIRYLTTKREYSYIKDMEEYITELIECKNIYTDTNELITWDNYERYIAPKTFNSIEEINNSNGTHFIFGELECFAQSDMGAAFYSEMEDDELLVIIVEDVKEE